MIIEKNINKKLKCTFMITGKSSRDKFMWDWSSGPAGEPTVAVQWLSAITPPPTAATAPSAVALSFLRHHEFDKHGRGEPRRVERRWHKTRNLQSDAEKDPGYALVTLNRGISQLRSYTQRILL